MGTRKLFHLPRELQAKKGLIFFRHKSDRFLAFIRVPYC